MKLCIYCQKPIPEDQEIEGDDPQEHWHCEPRGASGMRGENYDEGSYTEYVFRSGYVEAINDAVRIIKSQDEHIATMVGLLAIDNPPWRTALERFESKKRR